MRSGHHMGKAVRKVHKNSILGRKLIKQVDHADAQIDAQAFDLDDEQLYDFE